VKEESNLSRNLERLEMAHIKLEADLETSEIRPENNDCFRKNRMCSVLLSEDPPEHISARFRFASMAVRWDTAAGQRESNLMAHMVVSADVQETVSRVTVTSYLLTVETERQELTYGGKSFFS